MKNLYNFFVKFQNFRVFFKSFFVLVIIFLLFFAINLFVTIKNKPQSAYTSLNVQNEKSELILQDTRVHNWDEIEKKN